MKNRDTASPVPGNRQAAKAGGGLIRRLKELKSLVSNVDVEDRYPQRFDDPGHLDATQASLANDCARALEMGSLDESSIGLLATTVVGASLARTRAAIALHAAENAVALDAMESAEAKQVTYLEAVRARYEL